MIREWCLKDIFFFAKHILGYWWLSAPVHEEFAIEIQKDINLSLFLLPRGHCKTQLFTIADGIRNYLIAPEQPIAIVCDRLKRSVKKTRAMKWHFEHNRQLRSLFPDLVWQNPQKDSPKWTDEEFILPKHTGRQEPSFLATSLENQPTGLHFPRIKCDDIVTPETVTSKEMMDKNKDAYGLLRSSILQAGGNIQITGTIYDDGDLHCELIKSGAYRLYKRSASFDAAGKSVFPGTPKARSLWPEQFDLERLEEIRRDPTVGNYIFSCQYLLDPVPDESAFFQLNWFPRYSVLPTNLTMYASADLAISAKDSAAYTAITVVGANLKSQLYLVYVRRGHWDGMEIIDSLFDVQNLYKPLIWAIEVENIERTIGPFLRKAMVERQTFLNIEGFIPTQDKVARARSIQGRAREGFILLPASGATEPTWLADFEYEMRRFPKGATKDQVDSFALIGLLLDKQVSLHDGERPKPKTIAQAHIDAIERPFSYSAEDHLITEAVDSQIFWDQIGEGEDPDRPRWEMYYKDLD